MLTLLKSCRFFLCKPLLTDTFLLAHRSTILFYVCSTLRQHATYELRPQEHTSRAFFQCIALPALVSPRDSRIWSLSLQCPISLMWALMVTFHSLISRSPSLRSASSCTAVISQTSHLAIPLPDLHNSVANSASFLPHRCCDSSTACFGTMLLA